MSFVINLKADTGLVDRSENTTRFYKDIKDYKTLTREEEVEWFTKLKNGTEAEKQFARDYLIKCNQRLVIAAAKNYANTDNLTDYINEANFGLIEAIDKFDVNKKNKFATYALWFILRAINNYKYGTEQPIRKTNYSKTFHVISKANNKFMQDNERYPTEDELLDIINDEYGKDLRCKFDLIQMHMESIDDDNSDDVKDNTYSCTKIDYNAACASYNKCESNANNDFNKELVSSLLDILTEREQEIVKMRFGLCDDNGLHREYELSEISEKMGLTSERIRQIEASSLSKLKKEYQKRLNRYL